MSDDSIRVLRHSPAAFRARAEVWLLQREAEHNLLLGLAARLEQSTAGFQPPIYLATVERGRIAMIGGVVTVIWLVILVLMVWNG